MPQRRGDAPTRAAAAVWHAGLDALPIAALALLADARGFSQTAKSCVGAIALVTCSAIVVHVAGGAIAAHFPFFVVLPVIGLYGQWKPFLCAVGHIVVHHGIFALLAPRAVFPGHPDMG